LNFRRLLERHHLAIKLFQEINQMPADQRLMW
jgi:IS5 family transposase